MTKINVKKLYEDFAELGWDYTCNRMSRSAMSYYDAIAVNLGVLDKGEHWNEDAYVDKNCDHQWTVYKVAHGEVYTSLCRV